MSDKLIEQLELIATRYLNEKEALVVYAAADYIEELLAKQIHCSDCGSTWHDDGFTGNCPNCRIAELEAENDRLRDRRPGTPDAVTDEARLSISDKLIAERMKPERLAEIERGYGGAESVLNGGELLQALKAEREYAEGLKAENERILGNMASDVLGEEYAQKWKRKYDAVVEGAGGLKWLINHVDELPAHWSRDYLKGCRWFQRKLRALLEQEASDEQS